jgi:hypothetical protein
MVARVVSHGFPPWWIEADFRAARQLAVLCSG